MSSAFSTQASAADTIASKTGRNRVEVGNALNILRPTLGDDAGLGLYRLLRLVALEDIIGRGASGTAYIAGKKLGASLGITRLEDFLELCKQLKLGVIEVPVLTKNRMQVDVYECATCAGMTPVGRCLCHFEGGLVAGAVETVTGRDVRAKETGCIGGLGHDACSFSLEIR